MYNYLSEIREKKSPREFMTHTHMCAVLQTVVPVKQFAAAVAIL